MTLSNFLHTLLSLLMIPSAHRCTAIRYAEGIRTSVNESNTETNIILILKLKSKVLCLTSCMNNPVCDAISFDSKTFKCWHFHGNFEYVKTVDATRIDWKDTFYYNRFRPRDCLDLYTIKDFKVNGVYTIYADGVNDVDTYCRMDLGEGGWTVFQRRMDGSLDFYRDWNSYKYGFGSLLSEFWLGNKLIYPILLNGNYKLRIELEDFEGGSRYAEYQTFVIGPESDNYRLQIGNYSGNAGDAMAVHDGQLFSTKERDHDQAPENCAEEYMGAWWYNVCHDSNLNGLYLAGEHTKSSYGDGINWRQWKGYMYSLKSTTMMIKRIT